MKKIQELIEIQYFGVCTWWAEKLGVSISRVRLFFIYSSFFTLGSPLLVYLGMAFILDIRKLFRANNFEKNLKS